MLAPLTTLLLVLATLIILWANLLVTGFFLRQPPRGEYAMGLAVVLVGFVIAAALITAGSLLASFRSDRALSGLLQLPPWVTGVLTVLVAIGVALAAFLAFMAWAEPIMNTASLRALKFVLCLTLGVLGPVLLASLLILDAYSSPITVQSQPKAAAAFRIITLSVTGVALAGYLGSAYSLRQPLRTVASGLLQSSLSLVRDPRPKLPPGVTLASELRKSLEKLPADNPIPDLLGFLVIDDVAQDEECRQVVIQRLLSTPDSDRVFAEVMRSNKLRARWGGAVLIHIAPDNLLQAHATAWAHALESALLATAADMDSRPLFLSDNYELNPEPQEFVRAMLQAAKRFRDSPHHAAIDHAARTMAANATYLKRDKRWNKLAKVMSRAGYPIPEMSPP